MTELMRCLYCGHLQDEPTGVKECQRCGGELIYEEPPPKKGKGSYLDAQMELDQINAPAGQTVDRHLLISFRTPEKVPAVHLAKTESGRPPLSFSAVLDTSGSMHGNKIDYTKQALRMASRFFRDGDQFAMTVFSDTAEMIMKPTPVDRESKKVFESLVNEIMPHGLTALHSGLDLGIQQAQQMRSESNLTLLLSDGQANVGETDLEIIGTLARKAAEAGLIVSTLGVGMDYNEALMTEIATQGRGRFYHVQSAAEIVPYLTGELGEAADLAARDVKIHIKLPKGAALVPLSAAYQCEIIDNEAIVSIGDIPVDLDVEIPLRLTLFPGKENDRLEINGEITYLTPAGTTLTTSLNRVTVRFIKKGHFSPDMGVVKPVATRVAEQMRATQVLQYSRAVSRGNETELQHAEHERLKLREYFQLLDEDIRDKMDQKLTADIHSVRSASPRAKSTVRDAYQAQRFMRNFKDKK